MPAAFWLFAMGIPMANTKKAITKWLVNCSHAGNLKILGKQSAYPLF